MRSHPAFGSLINGTSGAALACPYCGKLFGFNNASELEVAQSAWPVFRYGRAELELKRSADGESDTTSLSDWALRHRFTQPGTHPPFAEYIYAEHAPKNETVP
jgi:hypothetical protein